LKEQKELKELKEQKDLSELKIKENTTNNNNETSERDSEIKTKLRLVQSNKNLESSNNNYETSELDNYESNDTNTMRYSCSKYKHVFGDTDSELKTNKSFKKNYSTNSLMNYSHNSTSIISKLRSEEKNSKRKRLFTDIYIEETQCKSNDKNNVIKCSRLLDNKTNIQTKVILEQNEDKSLTFKPKSNETAE